MKFIEKGTQGNQLHVIELSERNLRGLLEKLVRIPDLS